MSKNFKIQPEIISSYANFSKCGKYRYYLRRFWNTGEKHVMFIGLNPSTATASTDDPTIRRCINFAKSWGYAGMYMCNLYAYISTDPKKLIISGEEIAVTNSYLRECAGFVDIIVFAWGAFELHKKRMNEIIEMFPAAYCIKHTKNGYPSHPLYLKSDLKPIPFLQKCKYF